MKMTRFYRGATLKIVHVEHTLADTEDEVKAFAMQQAGETATSVFGSTFVRYDHEAQPKTVVTLHTD